MSHIFRNELDEARNRQTQTSHRIADMQHKIEELFSEKNRLQERLNIMEKVGSVVTTSLFNLLIVPLF